jgi:hypothetical protein
MVNKKTSLLIILLISLTMSLALVYGQEAKLVFNTLKGDPQEDIYLQSLIDLDRSILLHLNKQSNPATGLVESYQGTSGCYFDDASQQYYQQKEGLLDQQAFTYDLALAVIMYTINNQKERAEQILRILRNNFYSVKNGYTGLLTSYRTTEFDIWGEDTLLAGIDGDRIHVGPNMWVALAALHYGQINHTDKYLDFAIDIARWAYDLSHFKFADGTRGAVSMGSGWGPDWSNVYSTENVIDNYAVLNMLEQVYQQNQRQDQKLFEKHELGLKEIRYEKAAIKKWLLKIAYNRQYQSFNCGYNEFGNDTTKALDTVSWSIAAIGPEELIRWGLDPVKMIQFVEDSFLVQHNINGISISGFDFTDEKGKDPKRPRLIWWEGTGQMVVTYQVMAEFCQRNRAFSKAEEYEEKALRYLAEMNKMNALARLPKGVLPYTSIQPGDQEIINTFFFGWEIPRGKNGQWVAALSSTVWGVFGLSGFNPLSLEQKTIGKLQHVPNEMRAKINKALKN